MELYRMRWFVVRHWPGVPDHELLVISHRPEEGLVQEMPRNVLDDGSVSSKNCLGIDYL